MLDHLSGELREDGGELVGLDLWPETRRTLSAIPEIDTALVVPTDIADDRVAELSGWIDGVAVVQVAPEMAFADTGWSAGLSPGDPPTAFVSADRRLRGDAQRAGLYPAPHPAVLPMMIRGETPEAVRIVGPCERLRSLSLGEDVIPMNWQPAEHGRWSLIALATRATQTDAALRGLEMHALPYDPMTDDLVWARIDDSSDGVREALLDRMVLHAEPGQVLIALSPSEDAQALHIHGSHGHSEVLVPSPDLTRPAVVDSMTSDAIDAGSIPERILEPVKPDGIDPKIWRILLPRCPVVTQKYEEDIDRYTGVTALDESGPIVSRHSAHPDNKRAEAQLLKDLNAIGYCAYRHNFSHAGQTHSNIIADLPGTGIFRIRPDILKRYHRILRDHSLPESLRPFEREMHELATSDWFRSDRLTRMSDMELRYQIEKIFRLRPWYPWWKRLCGIAGYGADIVIVGCHMDSTAGFDQGYNASTDPAPGRDDNASGLAGVLSVARYLSGFRGRLTHTVRFGFFNAEESGLVGSKTYAAKMKALDAPIRATVCLDMIGHNSDSHKTFEVHAGYTDPAVRDQSLQIAPAVANAAAAYGDLAPAQIYAGTSWSGAPDRSVYDGAINRSDHAAFQQQGYPAVLVSEDFFVNLESEIGADPNPDYHRSTDTDIDLGYATSIVCAVARAVIDLAK